jgi:hypothetical protein
MAGIDHDPISRKFSFRSRAIIKIYAALGKSVNVDTAIFGTKFGFNLTVQ